MTSEERVVRLRDDPPPIHCVERDRQQAQRVASVAKRLHNRANIARPDNAAKPTLPMKTTMVNDG